MSVENYSERFLRFPAIIRGFNLHFVTIYAKLLY